MPPPAAAVSSNASIEYEEELFLALDGSATLNLNASVASLVALRGVDLDVDPRARIDRGDVRALFEGPGVEVTRVSLSRRDRRRFVHVSVDVADIRQAWRPRAVRLVRITGWCGKVRWSSSGSA